MKYRENPDIRKESGLVSFCGIEKPPWGFWVTKNDRDFGMLSVDGLKSLFMKIPARVLCYLLGQAERVNWM